MNQLVLSLKLVPSLKFLNTSLSKSSTLLESHIYISKWFTCKNPVSILDSILLCNNLNANEDLITNGITEKLCPCHITIFKNINLTFICKHNSKIVYFSLYSLIQKKMFIFFQVLEMPFLKL